VPLQPPIPEVGESGSTLESPESEDAGEEDDDDQSGSFWGNGRGDEAERI